MIAVVAVAIFGRQQIVERWYIYQLGSDDAETVDYAARRLAEMGSTRAIMPLIEQIPREVEKGRMIVGISRAGNIAYGTRPWMRCWTDSSVLKALQAASAAVSSDGVGGVNSHTPAPALDGRECCYSRKRLVA